MQREFERKLNSIENETIARVRQAGFMGASSEMEGDTTFGGGAGNIYKKPMGNEGTFFSGEQGVPSKIKGKLFKGTPFIRGNAEDKSKITELNVSNIKIIFI